jgi:ribonuclease P protein subunit RPR2
VVRIRAFQPVIVDGNASVLPSTFAGSKLLTRVRIPATAFPDSEKGENKVKNQKELRGIQKIALERIYRLFELAEKEFSKHPERSKRYVQLARAVGKRHNVSIPQELKKSYCKKCGAFLKKGKNSKMEKQGELLVLKCGECGAERKISAE